MPLQDRRNELVLLVSRRKKSPFGFAWEIRRFDHGVCIERATRTYPSETEARNAGEIALKVVASR